ncbi:MAG: proline dehydrogenase family protein [Armatimonadetes bacterium]|nr:proline dehydrogenase family protein [Armatimonadota bacterium]
MPKPDLAPRRPVPVPQRPHIDLAALVNRAAKALIFAVFGNRAVSAVVRRRGLTWGASRFVAGETLDAALEVARRLNAAGHPITVQFLGEHVTQREEAEAAVQVYLQVVEALARERIDGYISIKPSQMGLGIAESLCLANLERVLRAAGEAGIFVRLEMEESAFTEATLRIFRTLRPRYPGLGVVLQAYLYRSEDDLLALIPLQPNIRICKGAYFEPPEVAFPSKADVDRNFVTLVERVLAGGGVVAVATHDDRIIDHVIRHTQANHIPPDRFEFQMLYGIRPALQQQVRERGYGMRIYIPFGAHWYRYFVRRLAERPANIFFLLRNLLRR